MTDLTNSSHKLLSEVMVLSLSMCDRSFQQYHLHHWGDICRVLFEGVSKSFRTGRLEQELSPETFGYTLVWTFFQKRLKLMLC